MAPRRGMMRRGPGAPTEKAENFKGTLRELLKYMGVYKIALLFVMIFAVGSTAFTGCRPENSRQRNNRIISRPDGKNFRHRQH